ncbi:hypothetical protein OSTOST_15490, partial [Ostertagia ostertagi]
MPKTTTKAQTSVQIQQAADNGFSKISPVIVDHQKPSSFQLNGFNYQYSEDVLSVEEAVTCSQSDSTYNLTIVRNFLEELISRVQSSLNKTVVSWESVQQRFYEMMTGDDCPDIDLLGRYQLQMYFFQYALDEKVLEEWTGKKTVVEIFALPEFEGLECFREACPPHNLLVMVDRAKLKAETNSIAVGTEDTSIPSSNVVDPFELLESTSCTEELLIPIPLHSTLSTNNCSTDKNGLLPKSNSSSDLADDHSGQSPENINPEMSPLGMHVIDATTFVIFYRVRDLDLLSSSNGHAGQDTIDAQLNNSASTEQSVEISDSMPFPRLRLLPQNLPISQIRAVCSRNCVTMDSYRLSNQKRIHSTTSDASEFGSCMNSTKEHPNTKGSSTSVDGDDAKNPSPSGNYQDILTVETSREPAEQVSSTVKEGILVNSSSSEFTNSKDTEPQIAQSEPDPTLKLLQQAGIFPREMVPGMSEENGAEPTWGSANPSSSFESTPTCFRVSQVDASLEPQPPQAQLNTVGAPQDPQANEINSKMARSVLDGLEFPDINGDVINYLTFIRKQVLDYHERQGIIAR